MLTYQNGQSINNYPEEITDALLSICDGELSEQFKTENCHAELIGVLYHLKTVAENDLNRDGFKMLYQLLDNIADEIQNQSITNKWRIND